MRGFGAISPMKRLEIVEPLGRLRTPPWRAGPQSLSCIVPAFNEAAGLSQFLRDLHEAMTRLAPRVEIIVVDDGSEDETPVVAAGLARALGLHYVRLSRNFGKEAALTAGLDRAQGEAVLIMDADYQHPFEAVPAMIDRWREGYDVVFGVRRSRAGEGAIKRIGTRLLYGILSADAPVPIPAGAGDFRLLDRKVVEAVRCLPERNRFMKGLYAWVGFSSIAVPYDVGRRRHGNSQFSLRTLTRLGLDGVTAFTKLPLRIWSGFGILISVSALVYGGWIVAETLLWGNEVAGWPTIVASLMFFSGLQLISIGVIGEYLGRVFDEVKRRPIYVIGQELDCSAFAPGIGHVPVATSEARAAAYPPAASPAARVD
jgi:glycosyltransferase involved in cell wall biosynthesis